MLPDDIDGLIDGLPWHLKNKVLRVFSDEPEPVDNSTVTRVLTPGQTLFWWSGIALSFVWGTFMLVLGAMAVFILPLAMLLWFVGGIPMALLIQWRFVPTQQEGQHHG